MSPLLRKKIIGALSEVLFAPWGSVTDTYRPERHYMRGPGPKWHMRGPGPKWRSKRGD